jgi:NAD(P)-dependent dehydrogenase (short-subunit alcohol dehydrogenase family)
MATTVITGSASGIGAAIRARFESQGHKAAGIDVRDAEIVADLSTREGRAAAVASVRDRWEALDRFIVCAGLATEVRPPSLIPRVNYFGAIELLDGLFDLLQHGSDPSAVVVLSNSAQWAPISDTPYVQALLDHNEAEAVRLVDEGEDASISAGMAYIGSKFALGLALRRRAHDWGRAGVRLNGVAPGNTKTPMLQRVIDDPETRDAVLSIRSPLGRWAEPEDIANLVAFLCSPEALYMHGSVYYIDGGIDAQMRPDSF